MMVRTARTGHRVAVDIVQRKAPTPDSHIPAGGLCYSLQCGKAELHPGTEHDRGHDGSAVARVMHKRPHGMVRNHITPLVSHTSASSPGVLVQNSRSKTPRNPKLVVRALLRAGMGTARNKLSVASARGMKT